MTDFKNIQNRWNEQETFISVSSTELLNNVKKNTRELKHKHIWTQVILFLTCAVLIVFFFYVTAWKNTMAAIAISVMIGVVFLRLLLELVSLRKFRAIPVTEDFETYNSKLTRFYQWRRKVHFVFTPVILILYFASFVALMPIFKQTLSTGFYRYIQISSFIVFAGLSFSIWLQIKKEIGILTYLKDVNPQENEKAM